MAEKRKSGYYWIKSRTYPDSKWTVGYYDAQDRYLPWEVIGDERCLAEDEVIVGKQIFPPKEPTFSKNIGEK